MSTYNLNEYDAGVICADKKIAKFFEEVVKDADIHLAAKWIIGDLNALLNKHDISLDESKIEATNFLNLFKKYQTTQFQARLLKKF